MSTKKKTTRAPFVPQIPRRPNGTLDPTWGGRYCGYKKRATAKPVGSHPKQSDYCRHMAGFRTDHPRQGRCWLHGGLQQNLDPTPPPRGQRLFIRKSGGKSRNGFVHPHPHPYTQIVHNNLQDKWNTLMAAEYDVMDLVPEVNLLRSMAVDFINRYEDFVEQLDAWYADTDSNSKPRRIMDVTDASRIVESVSKVVERIHKIRSEGAITLETFRRVVEAMGITVAKFVADPTTLEAIEHEWNQIAVDARRPDPVPEQVIVPDIEVRALPSADEEWEGDAADA